MSGLTEGGAILDKQEKVDFPQSSNTLSTLIIFYLTYTGKIREELKLNCFQFYLIEVL